MPRYKITLSYDGTHYVGWQKQPNGSAIQEVVQAALTQILRLPVGITGAGRTDAGVHARAQTAHFSVPEPLDMRRLSYGVNAVLPADIRLLDMEEVPDDFHARYSATGKVYTYHLHLGPWHNPFNRLYTWHIPFPHFSLEKMKEGGQKLLGTHDFKGFAAEASQGVASYDSIRTLRRLEIIQTEKGREGIEVILLFEADGFLYKMVRNLVGTLVDIGRHHLPLEVMDEILRTHDRRLGGQTAPPQGLFLDSVYYS